MRKSSWLVRRGAGNHGEERWQQRSAWVTSWLRQDSGPVLLGSGKILARTKTCTVPPCIYTGPAELSLGPEKSRSTFLTGTVLYFVRTGVNTWTLLLFAQIARLWPGSKCRDWSKLCTDPYKHHCNRICTDPGTEFVRAKICPYPCKWGLNEQNNGCARAL